MKYSLESRAKMASSQIGKKHSEETRQKMSKIMTGKTHTEKSKEKASLAKMGHEVTPATREKIRKTLIGNIPWNNGLKGCFSEEAKIKIGDGHRGIKLSEETRRKISESLRGEKNPFFGKNHSEESKQKMSKIVLNTETGIFYTGVKRASESIGMRDGKLRIRLLGYTKNNTPFIYA